MNLDQAVKAYQIVNRNMNFNQIKKIMKKMDNKFPGKDISSEDLTSKFPLAAKKS